MKRRSLFLPEFVGALTTVCVGILSINVIIAIGGANGTAIVGSDGEHIGDRLLAFIVDVSLVCIVGPCLLVGWLVPLIVTTGALIDAAKQAGKDWWETVCVKRDL